MVSHTTRRDLTPFPEFIAGVLEARRQAVLERGCSSGRHDDHPALRPLRCRVCAVLHTAKAGRLSRAVSLNHQATPLRRCRNAAPRTPNFWRRWRTLFVPAWHTRAPAKLACNRDWTAPTDADTGSLALTASMMADGVPCSCWSTKPTSGLMVCAIPLEARSTGTQSRIDGHANFLVHVLSTTPNQGKGSVSTNADRRKRGRDVETSLPKH